MKDNKNRFKINEDGFVSVDLSSKEAICAILVEVEKCKGISNNT